MSESKKLYGRKEIAAYVGTLRRPASEWYVSAMIKAGLKVEYGNSTTTDEVDRFFRANPNFSTSDYKKKRVVQHVPTHSNMFQRSAD